MNLANLNRQRGALMIEVLVTIVITVIGLLALFQMQARLQKTEMESYQRTQAMMLVNDMASRIATNRANIMDYVTGDDALGAGMVCSSIGTGTIQQEDSSEWCNALQGAAETDADDATVKAGAMIGGRGCIHDALDPANNEVMITVVWQGLVPISKPPVPDDPDVNDIGVTCGEGEYDQVDTDCVDDLCRRYVTTLVRVGNLADS